MPLEMGKKFVEGIDGVEAMWVTGTGEVVYSEGFKSFLKVDNEKITSAEK